MKIEDFIATIDIIAGEICVCLDLDFDACVSYILHHLDEFTPLDKYKSVSKRKFKGSDKNGKRN